MSLQLKPNKASSQSKGLPPFHVVVSCVLDYVEGHVQKNHKTKEQVNEFPTPIALNAFRGFLDEYQKKRPQIKQKKAKEANKKKRRNQPQKEVSYSNCT